jgi:FKBP-type peptidyl-prolyl cis-trans isomerase
MSVPRIALVAVAVLSLACAEAEAPEVTVETEDQKLMYAVGMGVAMQFDFGGLFTEEELVFIKQGLSDIVLQQPTAISVDDNYMQRMNELVMERRSAANLESGASFLEQAVSQEGAVQTASGLVYQELVAGTGAHPSATDSVTVHYEGSFADGRVFDSSIKRGEPTTFMLGQVIPGWIEGLQLMKPGGKARLVIPSELGYGAKGYGNIPPNATLIFEVELLSIQ